jgi:hypothetical protein
MALRSRSLVHAFARVVLPLLLGAHAALAHAAFIDFEDLPPIPGNEDVTGYPVTNQYAHLGVTFEDRVFLVHWTEDATLASFLDDNALGFRFSGTLPTHVSFDVLSGRPVSVRWRGATGRGANIELDQGSHVSFSSEAGIALVRIARPVGVRPDFISFDNLYFGSVPAVPEPAPLALAGAGVLALAWRRWRQRRAGNKCAHR